MGTSCSTVSTAMVKPEMTIEKPKPDIQKLIVEEEIQPPSNNVPLPALDEELPGKQLQVDIPDSFGPPPSSRRISPKRNNESTVADKSPITNKAQNIPLGNEVAVKPHYQVQYLERIIPNDKHRATVITRNPPADANFQSFTFQEQRLVCELLNTEKYTQETHGNLYLVVNQSSGRCLSARLTKSKRFSHRRKRSKSLLHIPSEQHSLLELFHSRNFDYSPTLNNRIPSVPAGISIAPIPIYICATTGTLPNDETRSTSTTNSPSAQQTVSSTLNMSSQTVLSSTSAFTSSVTTLSTDQH
jgi:hypothetical protein